MIQRLFKIHSLSKSYRSIKQTCPSRIQPGNASVIWIQSLLASPNSITSELSNRILQNWKFWFHSHPGSLTNIAMLRQVRSSNWQLTAELSRKATWWTQTDRKQRYSEMEKLKVKKQHGKPMRRQVACLQSERVCWWTLQTKCIPFFEDWQTGAVSCHKLLLKLLSYRIQLNWWKDLTDFPIDTKMYNMQAQSISHWEVSSSRLWKKQRSIRIWMATTRNSKGLQQFIYPPYAFISSWCLCWTDKP